MENNKLDKRTKWSYCIGATGRDMAYALISMFLLTYIQYTMKLTVAQYAVISAIMVVCPDYFRECVCCGMPLMIQ